jgi:hypothetical protein
MRWGPVVSFFGRLAKKELGNRLSKTAWPERRENSHGLELANPVFNAPYPDPGSNLLLRTIENGRRQVHGPI